jgi:large subunit ribosomal protein L6
MSRIGKMPVEIKSGVSVELQGDEVKVLGTKGDLTQQILPGVKVEIKDSEVVITRASDTKLHKSNHGLMRTLIYNMVIGVSEGFSKKLEINGVGYRVAKQGDKLNFSLGFSHEVIYNIPQGIDVAVEQNTLTVTGISKQKVGQVAAEIRALKKPEPYKGKGIKYENERIIRKAGKSGKDK